MWLRLLNSAIAINSPPSGATAGFSLRSRQPGLQGYWRGKNDGVLLIKSTAGSGTMTATFRVWAYSPLTAAWHVLGSNSTEASRGVLNTASAVDEDGADNLHHAEPVTGLAAFTRVYLEVTAISGTDTAVSAYLVTVDDGQL